MTSALKKLPEKLEASVYGFPERKKRIPPHGGITATKISSDHTIHLLIFAAKNTA
ncbi:MAG: hypothetical protein K2Q13_03700 [Nitrosomonas sp.]|uniref:hypothetical protein n=1 Tax=Nitrosomonas sp. TaxID=42353 RepID=UPI0025FDFE3E|nr:hypothetical protein [Nitrosomonas sp.]MBY0474150.1 hypothetical protein [Nitrosomonas sp.]